MKKILILFLMLFVSLLPCFADTYKVLRVIDGDTIDYSGPHVKTVFCSI